MGIIRRTKGVTSVLQFFEDCSQAYSVVDLRAILKDSMNKTTVYRILDRLEQEGVIHSFNGRDGLRWYAKCEGCSTNYHLDKHPHFQCTKCDKVECLPLEIEIPTLKNHKVYSSDILLMGECEACCA